MRCAGGPTKKQAFSEAQGTVSNQGARAAVEVEGADDGKVSIALASRLERATLPKIWPKATEAVKKASGFLLLITTVMVWHIMASRVATANTLCRVVSAYLLLGIG